MSITLTALQKQRTDTAANWTSANPTLLSGELGFESDTGKAKLGNGSTAWTSLGYLGVIPSSGTYPLSQLIMPLGTAGAPPLTFVGDVNTGIYSPGADQVSVSTGGTERLRIDSTGQIEAVSLGTAAAPTFTFTGDPDTGVYSPGANQLAISTNGTGQLFIDSSGKLLVGTSSAATSTKLVVQGRTDSAAGNAAIALQRGSLPTGADQIIGSVQFTDNSQNFGATISAVSDGSWTSGSNHRSRLQFSTTADGASSPTERLRITSAGLVGIGTSSPGRPLDVTGVIQSQSSSSSGGLFYGLYTGTTAGSQLGNLNFYGNGAGVTAETAVRGILDTGSTTAAYLTFSTTPSAGSLTERVRIDSTGRVGIGTTSPGTVLDIVGSGNPTLTLRGSAVNNSPILNLQAGGSGESVIDATGGSTALRLLISGSERARIDSSGRLLVGTSTALTGGDTQYSKLVLQGNTVGATGPAFLAIARGETAATTASANQTIGRIVFSDSAAGQYATIGCVTDAAVGNNDYPSRLEFSTTADGASSPTERMRITNAGALYHFSTASDLIACATTKGAGTTDYIFTGGYSSSGPMNFGTNSIRIYTNGNVQNTNNSYTAISDVKLKENIVDANSQWGDIKALQVRNYNLKEGQTHKQIGLIAQEVESISPGLVYESPDRDAEGNDLGTVTKSVNYSVLYMKAVKALQEAMERIEQLEAQMAEVKAQLS